MINIKSTQLKAMNTALYNFSLKTIEQANLATKDANTIKQTVLYNQPYNNVEVVKSNRLYKTCIDLAENIVENVVDIKNK